MKTHSTNYYNTLIEVAPDTLATQGSIPPLKDKKTIAQRLYLLIEEHPYQYTSDEVLFKAQAEAKKWEPADWPQKREEFFSKGQACLRASALTKTYGFGIYANNKGQIALVPMESERYQTLLKDDSIQKVKAMRCRKTL
jgi:hypothetical protein